MNKIEVKFSFSLDILYKIKYNLEGMYKYLKDFGGHYVHNWN